MESFELLISSLRAYTNALESFDKRLDRLEANVLQSFKSQGEKVMSGIADVNSGIDRVESAVKKEIQEVADILRNLKGGATQAELDGAVKRLDGVVTAIDSISSTSTTEPPVDPGV